MIERLHRTSAEKAQIIRTIKVRMADGCSFERACNEYNVPGHLVKRWMQKFQERKEAK